MKPAFAHAARPGGAVPPASPFQSFVMGGFEGSTFRIGADGAQRDIIAATRHDRLAGTDYRLLAEHGLRTTRDAMRWHLIEAVPGRYDWSSWLPMAEAAARTGMQVIWDLCHYGVPADLDIWSDAFIPRFTAFARAAAEQACRHGSGPALWSVMNEISFWSWAGGEVGWIYPFARERGGALKRRLAAAAIAATRAIRTIDPAARFIQAEPMIHIVAQPDRPGDAFAVERYRLAQYEAWDMLAGRLAPELGGSEDILDIVGGNFYFNNQWIHEVATMPMGHWQFRPFADMLIDAWDRYRRPMIVAETGAEGAGGRGWLRYVAGEVRDAIARGAPMLGLCLYPVLDYPGWADGRHCACGLIGASGDWSSRFVRPDMGQQIAAEQTVFASLDAARLGIGNPAIGGDGGTLLQARA